jgi:2-methylisocitrate lyase-like PEP mutase family enzyme
MLWISFRDKGEPPVPVTQAEKAARFQALHQQADAFVIPNPWDAGSARVLAGLGFAALATTSAGFAFSIGYRDGEGAFGRDTALAHAKSIVEATDLPVSADLENGFGHAPEAAAETIRAAGGVGLAGGSIEDASGETERPIYDFAQAVERVAAAVEAARGLPVPFVLTARAENFLHGRPDLDDTIRRLQAFAAAGADVLYAPGLPDIEAIRTVCAAVDKPVNVVMGLTGEFYSVAELAAAGVKRISVGGSLSRAALDGFLRAAREIAEQGTFDYARTAARFSEVAAFMKGPGE